MSTLDLSNQELYEKNHARCVEEIQLMLRVNSNKADAFYKSNCSQWVSFDEYKKIKLDFIKGKEVRKKLSYIGKTEREKLDYIKRLLETNNLNKADEFYENNCALWLTFDEYEKIKLDFINKNREQFLRYIQYLLGTSFKEADAFYEKHCNQWLALCEYEKIKLDFINKKYKKIKSDFINKSREKFLRNIQYLLETNFKETDAFYEKHCNQWLALYEYEKIKLDFINKKREEFLNNIRQIFETNFWNADTFYKNNYTQWVKLDEYYKIKLDFIDRRRKCFFEEIHNVLKRNFYNADLFYKVNYDTQWVELSEYEEIKAIYQQKRDYIKNAFENNFIEADSIYEKDCSQHIEQKDYEKEKLDFVRRWFQEHLKNEIQPDDEQLRAIASVNGHIQVIARAGSGKTATLIHRAYFLMQHCHIKPIEMLLLAFNRKAANEMLRRLLFLLKPEAQERLEEQKQDDENHILNIAKEFGITLPFVMTFHALAYRIVHPDEDIIYDEDEMNERQSFFIQEIIDMYLQNDDYKKDILNLMLEYFSSDLENIIQGNYKFYRDKIISMFLFERAIPYYYNKNYYYNHSYYTSQQYSFGDTNFKAYCTSRVSPHYFKIPYNQKSKNNRKGLIIECFFDKNENTIDTLLMHLMRNFIKKARENMKYWNNEGYDFIYFFIPQYRTEFSNRVVKECFSRLKLNEEGIYHQLEDLEVLLKKLGFQCAKLTEEEIYQPSKYKFSKIAKDFIGRCRKNCLSIEALNNKISNEKDKFLKNTKSLKELLRELETKFSDEKETDKFFQKFYRLMSKIYTDYLNKLKTENKEDFDGLIQRAIFDNIEQEKTSFAKKNYYSGDCKDLRYIFIDEFQDFSELFYQLIQSILKKNQQVQLFCVGDDWQAINGFAGSNLKFFNGFKEWESWKAKNWQAINVFARINLEFFDNFCQWKDLNQKPQKLDLLTNYRSPEKIVELGNTLMQGVGKGKPALPYKKNDSHNFLIDADEFEQSIFEILREEDKTLSIVTRLVNQTFKKNQEVVLLFRRNKDKDNFPLQDLLNFFPTEYHNKISISTTHKYKGLENKVVIIMNATKYQYPLINPSWIFFKIFGDNIYKITDEERRLFYVALTRASEQIFVITQNSIISPFVSEIKKLLTPIVWSDFPPVILINETGYIIQLSGDTSYCKNLIQKYDYQYNDSKKIWWKITTDPKYLENIQKEEWVDIFKKFEFNQKITIKILTLDDKLLEYYSVSFGKFEKLL